MKNKDSLVEVKINDITFNTEDKERAKLLDEHLKVISEYDAENALRGNTLTTRHNQIDTLIRYAKFIKKPFRETVKKDINSYLTRYNGGSLERYKVEFKKFYRWLGKPKLVEHLKAKKNGSNITSDMIWTEEEINSLLNVVDPSTKERDQAIIMMSYDLALERKALVGLNIGDIFDTGDTLKVKVTGKVRGEIKTRVLECIISIPYLKAWLNVHPDSKNPKAPLFISYATNHFGERMHPQRPTCILQKLAKRAKIDKPIWNHLIRHSRATSLYKKGYRGIPLQKFLGHSNISTQQLYAHMCDDDINDERFKIDTGIDRRYKKKDKRALLTITCPRCGAINRPTDLYCRNKECHYLLNQKMAQFETMMVEMLRSEWYGNVMKSLKDEESQGKKVPVDAMNPKNLVEVFQRLEETPEQKKKRLETELEELVGK